MGKKKNPFDKGVYGIGCVGDGEHLTMVNNKITREYALWHKMMARCYSEANLKTDPSYRGVKVCERWHNFQNFCNDLPSIDGYEMWFNNPKTRVSLDKDLKQKGVKNKVYSPETCTFVTHKQNLDELVDRIKRAAIGTNIKTGEQLVFEPISESNKHGFDSRHIIKCCKGERKTHKGFTWEYKY